MSASRVVALLGRGVVPAGTAVLAGADTGALHADGIFETMLVRRGRARRLDAHLDRLAGSAARLSLDLPDRGRLAELVDQAVSTWPADREGALRLICPHGGPTFVTIAPVGDRPGPARRDGVRVITAALPAEGRRGPAGAKALSYAMNLVQLRRARAAGADDTLWVSAEGYALEGPTSALVWLAGTTLGTVPVESTGILPSTTAAFLRTHAGTLGWSAAAYLITPDQLTRADGAWLTSAVRGAVAIRSLDVTPLRYDPAVTARVQAVLHG